MYFTISREKNKSLGGFPNYKDYVEKYEPEQKVSEPTETSTVPVDQPAPSLRISEIAASFAVFLVLLGLGLRNIHTANASINTSITQTPTKTSVLSESTSVTPTPSPSHQPKITVVVKTGDQSATVNIRKEPSTNAPVIGKATNGQTFEMVSIVESAWYEVKLEDGSVGYITSKYIVQQPNE